MFGHVSSTMWIFFCLQRCVQPHQPKSTKQLSWSFHLLDGCNNWSPGKKEEKNRDSLSPGFFFISGKQKHPLLIVKFSHPIFKKMIHFFCQWHFKANFISFHISNNKKGNMIDEKKVSTYNSHKNEKQKKGILMFYLNVESKCAKYSHPVLYFGRLQSWE